MKIILVSSVTLLIGIGICFTIAAVSIWYVFLWLPTIFIYAKYHPGYE